MEASWAVVDALLTVTRKVWEGIETCNFPLYNGGHDFLCRFPWAARNIDFASSIVEPGAACSWSNTIGVVDFSAFDVRDISCIVE
jgi:hypothetical protein